MASRQPNLIDNMRAWAIFSVVCAHVISTPPLTNFSASLWSFASPFGVFIFLVISGYLAGGMSQGTLSSFAKHKARRLCVPWFFTGTLVFLYVSLRHGEDFMRLPLHWFLFLVGVRSYFWYMTILTILLFLFRVIGGSRICLWCIPLVSLASYLTSDTWYPHVLPWGGGYLNLANWMLPFWLGFVVRHKVALDALFPRKKEALTVFAVSNVILALLFMDWLHRGIQLCYWHACYPMYSHVALAFVVAVAKLTEESRLLAFIGRDSFAIYLLHLPLAGGVAHLNRIHPNALLMLASPFLVLIGTEFLIVCYRMMLNHFNAPTWLYGIIGLRLPPATLTKTK